MKKALLIVALPLLQLAATQAFAADTMSPDAPKTRAQVKADTKAAGAPKPGEAGPAAMIESKAPAGDKSRKEVKAETKAAAKSGDLPKPGEAAATKEVETKPMSTKSRSEVKADAKPTTKDTAVKIGDDNKNGK